MLLAGRLVRLLIFTAGILVGYAVAQFVSGNRQTIAVSIWPYDFTVPVYLLALVPLGIGLAAGYLYTTPARAHEFAEHWRSWRALRQMEKENRSLRRSLDKVLDLPDEEPARALAQLEAPVDPDPVGAARPVGVLDAAATPKASRSARKPSMAPAKGGGRAGKPGAAATATAS
jgi:hypothetical protein